MADNARPALTRWLSDAGWTLMQFVGLACAIKADLDAGSFWFLTLHTPSAALAGLGTMAFASIMLRLNRLDERLP